MTKNIQHDKILSTNGIHQLAVSEWNAVEQPRAVLQIVHGMREYMQRYDDFARYLNANQVTVVGYDHLGHGDTVNTPDDFGHFGDDKGAKILVADCTMMTLHFREKYKELPFFLLGHSMGSFITRLSVLKTAPVLDGYLCMGTAGPQALMPFTRVYAELLSTFRGTEKHSDLTDRMMEIYSMRRLKNTSSPDAWISRDPETVRKFSEDPKTRFFFTNQAYADLLDLQLACNQKEWFLRYSEDLPTFFVSGEEDPVGNFGKDIPYIADSLASAGVFDVSYHLYPQARHEILNEFNREQVYYDLLTWMSNHLPSP